MSIVKNKLRVGRFTSSEIHKLIPYGSRPMTPSELVEFKKANPKSQKRNCEDGFNAGGLTYIRHKRQERKRKRSLSTDSYSKVTAWGHFMEIRVFELIGVEYEITSNQTDVHPKYDFWAGSKDLIVKGVKVSEIKSYQPEKFCDYADCLLEKNISKMKSDFPEEYWQIVSNAAINGTKKGEAILYQPYDSEAEDIYNLVVSYEGDDGWKYQFIADAINSKNLFTLPFQPNDSEYPNLVIFEFEVPQEDIDFLTERVLEAEKILKS